MDKLRQQLLRKSAGVFLWVVLVIPRLNSIYNQGRGFSAMLRELENVPKSLYDVFANILSRDAENLDECITLIRWILFSLRPLRPIELYAAVQKTCSLADIDDSIVPVGPMLAKYLLHCSRGLVEITPAEPPVVQFIHETVRDFLINAEVRGGRLSAGNGISVILPDFQADSHHITIAEDCLQYLLNVSQETLSTKPSTRQHPLVSYAAEYWWRHM